MDKSLAIDGEDVQSNHRFISSGSTAIVKFIAPAFIFFMGAFFEFCTWKAVHGDKELWAMFRGNTASPLPTSDTLILIPVIAGVILLCWLFHYSPVKRVRIDGQSLYILNYLKEIAVPLSKVSAVKQNKWDRRLAKIIFRSATTFGGKITFYAPIRFWEDWYADINPVIRELRQAIAASSGTAANL